MSIPRIEVTKTVTERGTFKAPVRDCICNWDSLVAQFNIPEDAVMQIEIPGGGDCSGMSIDASELDVVVTWERTTDE